VRIHWISSQDKATKIFRIAIINKYNYLLLEVWRLLRVVLCRLARTQIPETQHLYGFHRAGLWWLSVAGLWRLYFGQKKPLSLIHI